MVCVLKVLLELGPWLFPPQKLPRFQSVTALQIRGQTEQPRALWIRRLAEVFTAVLKMANGCLLITDTAASGVESVNEQKSKIPLNDEFLAFTY